MKQRLDTAALEPQFAHCLQIDILLLGITGMVGHLEERIVGEIEAALQLRAQPFGKEIAQISQQRGHSGGCHHGGARP
jgi:hypothetical protein